MSSLCWFAPAFAEGGFLRGGGGGRHVGSSKLTDDPVEVSDCLGKFMRNGEAFSMVSGVSGPISEYLAVSTTHPQEGAVRLPGGVISGHEAIKTHRGIDIYISLTLSDGEATSNSK